MKKILTTGIYFFACSFLVLAQVPSYVPTSGLVGWWPFNGNANDQSGNGLNGVVTAATLTADRNNVPNAAYYFNGANGTKIQVADNSLLHSGNYTVSAWEYVTDPTIYNNIVSKRIVSTSTNSYILYEPTKTSCTLCNLAYQPFEIASSIGGTQRKTYLTYNTLDSVMNYTWNMITGSYDGSSLKFYINGQLIRTLAITGPVNYSTDPLYFGTTGSAGQNFKGNIDDIGIWDRALSSNEILALYTGITSVPNSEVEGSIADLTVYPNPAKEHLTLKANSKLIGKAFSIYDQNANLIQRGTLKTELTELNLAGFAAGNYSIQLDNKFIKNFTVLK